MESIFFAFSNKEQMKIISADNLANILGTKHNDVAFYAWISSNEWISNKFFLIKLIYRILTSSFRACSLSLWVDKVQDQRIISVLRKIVNRSKCDAIEIRCKIGSKSFLTFFEFNSFVTVCDSTGSDKMFALKSVDVPVCAKVHFIDWVWDKWHRWQAQSNVVLAMDFSR